MLVKYAALITGPEGLLKYVPSTFHPVHFDFLRLDPEHADVKATSQSLAIPSHDVISRSSNMWRGAICMAASEGLGGSAERGLPLAVSIELLHSAGLIMDDLQEKRSRGRGLASMHLVYGKGPQLTSGVTCRSCLCTSSLTQPSISLLDTASSTPRLKKTPN
jgi:hypothetical protein